MVIGFCLIGTESQKEGHVYNSLIKEPYVEYIHPLFGEYDIIAKVEAADYKELNNLKNRIREISGVKSAKIHPVTTFDI